jgi:hypothetical protein
MRVLCTLLFVLVTSVTAFAGDWKQESHDGRGKWTREYKADGEWKEEYDDGNCKIERKREKTGKFEEKVDCKQTPVSGRFYLPRR